MSEWWSYRLSDFLLFSPRAYWRLFELHNEAFWPLPALMLALGGVTLALAIRRPQRHGRLIAILLALPWAFVGWSFLWQRYAAINWAAAYVAPLFALEAALLIAVGGILDRLRSARSGVRRIAGSLLVALALAYPLLAPMSGRPWIGAEVFGMAPDPTAAGTLGLLLMVRGRAPVALGAAPLLWCLASGVTLWALGEPQAWVPLGVALSAMAASLWPAAADSTDRPA